MSELHFNALSREEAYNLADSTKTTPQYGALTPKWFTKFLAFKGLSSGIYRINRVKEGNTPLDVLCSLKEDDREIPTGFVAYEKKPKEVQIAAVSSILNIDTRISDVYSYPHDQTELQVQLAVESLQEHQESQLINNPVYGLLPNAAPEQRVKPRYGAPMPDDMDALIAKVWKEPSFFVAHPLAIAAFGRECTRRGVPPATVEKNGGVFLTWRGIPILPSDKLLVDGKRSPKKAMGKTDILLVRTGEANRGVLGLYMKDLPGEEARGISVRLRGIDDNGIASYLLSIYCSMAILSDDAVGVLEGVEIGHHYDYGDK